MIGLIIVSHNRNLGEEIINLTSEMKSYPFKVVNGSGTSGDYYGTEPNIILEAIKVADEGDGAVILCDLGSAVMNAQMSLEFLEPEQQERIIIADAPIVEGALVAMSANCPGISIGELVEEIEESRGFSKLD
ncbi:dihydroxyacetone kinase phosphoryl donor subunit DhaM [Ilyobacter sp.]|uniref:dihydroxyacetone kinase phosphoryl donor subunit DhaM n=1 Tax=Ilyobacter sp. TaxID=3100343 RepID=UPI0035657D35